MRASLDTNVIIHFYRAHLQQILFDFFEDGVFIYEQIRDIELENHGQDILNQVDEDIAMGRIEVYTDKRLKELSVFKMFENHVKESRMLYKQEIWEDPLKMKIQSGCKSWWLIIRLGFGVKLRS